MKKILKEKGITLIALVITIIILLILAGVSIAMLTGDNGIITRANEASEKTKYTGAKETVEIEANGSFDDNGKYSADIAKENLEKNLGATVIKNADNTLDVTYDGYDFKIDLDGEVTEANYFKLSEITESNKQGEHTLGIDEEGNLWAWGRNENGELGNGTTENSAKPIQILEGTKFKKVSSGNWFSIAIDEEGNLWSWGQNARGQLGNGTETDRDQANSPAKIKEGTKFKEISAGRTHSLALDEEGNIWSWGSNDDGQLGNGTDTASNTPVKILEGTKFKKVSSGDRSSIAIDEEGSIWSWGKNNYGQLGNGTNTASNTPVKILEGTKFKEISAGNSHCLAIDEDGNLWSWGQNHMGQLGDGTTTNSNIPVKILEGTKFKKISAGYYCSSAIDEEENLWSWGLNSEGQLGNGTTTNINIPVKILEGTKFKNVAIGSAAGGRAYSVAIDIDGNVWTTGNNFFGQLGRNQMKDNDHTFQRIEIPQN